MGQEVVVSNCESVFKFHLFSIGLCTATTKKRSLVAFLSLAHPSITNAHIKGRERERESEKKVWTEPTFLHAKCHPLRDTPCPSLSLYLIPVMMSLVVNELMRKLSMSSAKIRRKKAVHCTHNDRLSDCPQDVTGQPC